MLKVLFLIHDLAGGGAEKVLVNLVNNMDKTKFDITVMALFGGGVNEQFLCREVRYKTVFSKVFPGNSKVMQLLSPRQLHRLLIQEVYDIEVSYLEGPSARVISGCPNEKTKLVCWIHAEQGTKKAAAASFRSYRESARCYERFHRIIGVSAPVKRDMEMLYPRLKGVEVLYNTNETEKILLQKKEPVEHGLFSPDEIKLVSVGRLIPLKGFDRLARIHARLRQEGYPVHFYALGAGMEQKKIEKFLRQRSLEDTYTFLGYQMNPYKYVAKCDIFVCASVSESFSMAVAEALIVGIPVVTTDVAIMRELLGQQDEYGIVTENSEEALYQGIKRLLDRPELRKHYAEQAKARSAFFSTENTVAAAEKMLLRLARKA